MSRSGTAFGVVGAGGAVSGGDMAQPTCRTGTNSDAAVMVHDTTQASAVPTINNFA